MPSVAKRKQKNTQLAQQKKMEREKAAKKKQLRQQLPPKGTKRWSPYGFSTFPHGAVTRLSNALVPACLILANATIKALSHIFVFFKVSAAATRTFLHENTIFVFHFFRASVSPVFPSPGPSLLLIIGPWTSCFHSISRPCSGTPMLSQTFSAVNRFIWSRLERHSGCFAAVTAFYFGWDATQHYLLTPLILRLESLRISSTILVTILFLPSSCCLGIFSFQFSSSSCKWFALRTYIYCSFWLYLLLVGTMVFHFWVFDLKRFNYSNG